MHVQHQKGIPPTIPKCPSDDHKTYTVRKNINTITNAFLLTSSSVQRKKHLPSAVAGLLSSPFATENLHTLRTIYINSRNIYIYIYIYIYNISSFAASAKKEKETPTFCHCKTYIIFS